MSTDPARELAIQIEAQEDLYFFSRYMFKERRGNTSGCITGTIE